MESDVRFHFDPVGLPADLVDAPGVVGLGEPELWDRVVAFGVEPDTVGVEEDWHGGSRRQRSERG